MILRDSLLLSSILFNSEAWYGLTAKHINQLESVDKLLLRKVLNTAISTPIEAMYLELGILSIITIIKIRRINFQHYLVTRKENEMLSKVFIVQWTNPLKDDWNVQVKKDPEDLCIIEDLEAIRRFSNK